MYTSIAVARRRHADGDATSIATPRRSSSPRRSAACGRSTSSSRARARSIRRRRLAGRHVHVAHAAQRRRPPRHRVPRARHRRDRRARRGSLRVGADRDPDERRRLAVLDRRQRRCRDPRRTRTIYPLPGGLGLFVDSARNPRPGACRRLLRPRERRPQARASSTRRRGQFATPVVLDGSNGVDAGWSPSVAVDAQRRRRTSRTSARPRDDLKYITDAADAKPEIIDDGYRIVGTTVDGLPEAGVPLRRRRRRASSCRPAARPIVVYQDATTQELLLAQRKAGRHVDARSRSPVRRRSVAGRLWLLRIGRAVVRPTS